MAPQGARCRAGLRPRRDPLASARLYSALGLRILAEKQSKYYGVAIEHLDRARTLYEKGGDLEAWPALVAAIRAEHHRKKGFMDDLDALVETGEVPRDPTLLERARERIARSQLGS